MSFGTQNAYHYAAGISSGKLEKTFTNAPIIGRNLIVENITSTMYTI